MTTTDEATLCSCETCMADGRLPRGAEHSCATCGANAWPEGDAGEVPLCPTCLRHEERFDR